MRKIFVLIALACSLLVCAAAQAAQITDVKWGVNKEEVLRFVVDLTDNAGYAVDIEGSVLNLTVNASKGSQVAAQGNVKSALATSYQVVDREHYTIVRVPLRQSLSESHYKSFTLKQDAQTNRPFRVVLDIMPAQRSVKAPMQSTAKAPAQSSVKAPAQTTAPVVSNRPVVSSRPTRPAGARPAQPSTPVKSTTSAAQAGTSVKSSTAAVKQPTPAPTETKQTTITSKKETKQPEKDKEKKEVKNSTSPKVVNASSKQTKIVGNGKFRISGGLSGKIITLDAGHGGSDPGAIGSDGTKEKNITLAITKAVKELLEKKGAKVYMTRTTDVDVYGPNASDADELQARVNVGEKYNSDLFVSLHINSSVNKNVGGFSTYYYPKTNNDLRIAKSIQDQLTANFGVDDLGVRQANFYVIKRISMPATLVEMCFISNEKELVLMKGKWFQNKTARLIAAGIEKYFA
ncbi:N-acetylmuramoyl-L-alanine amidase [uncultured Phascolarctobacterium sp.]|uniref:N-acetylmuramoyl-L-alanine amidase family protein n=1 Tax=uncultured Phascolarctobacterium sp. TaxID=512296 RepID=UPI0025E0D7C5|nr:N-acetylmuramoyl-L-alanine amidase [uncultured Phascolarctobacterium sp.]